MEAVCRRLTYTKATEANWAVTDCTADPVGNRRLSPMLLGTPQCGVKCETKPLPSVRSIKFPAVVTSNG